MQIVSSYGVEIKKKNIPLRATLDIFRKAVSYLIPVYAETSIRCIRIEGNKTIKQFTRRSNTILI